MCSDCYRSPRLRRAIAEQLKISRNTVKKYLEMSAEEVAVSQARKGRTKRLDVHREVAAEIRGWLGQLPPEVADKLAHGNAERLFGGAAQPVSFR
jgi:predicted ArsR family transcriptional regulator